MSSGLDDVGDKKVPGDRGQPHPVGKIDTGPSETRTVVLRMTQRVMQESLV